MRVSIVDPRSLDAFRVVGVAGGHSVYHAAVWAAIFQGGHGETLITATTDELNLLRQAMVGKAHHP